MHVNWYDYGARFYDPSLGRWHTPDPMAENYDGWSPYNFTLNNPICNYDPNGMWVETDKGYNTNDPDEIAQFLKLFGIGPNNQPKDEGQAKDQESLRKRASNVAKGIEKLYTAEREAISYLPGGSFLNEIIDQKTGYESDDNLGYNLGFDAAGIFLPGVKLAKGPLVKGITVLGSYDIVTGGYVGLAKKIGANYFQIPPNIWAKISSAEQWAANVKFLNRMMARGDNIVLSNSARLAEPGTSFYKELQYLYSKGYKPAADGMSLIKP